MNAINQPQGLYKSASLSRQYLQISLSLVNFCLDFKTSAQGPILQKGRSRQALYTGQQHMAGAMCINEENVLSKPLVRHMCLTCLGNAHIGNMNELCLGHQRLGTPSVAVYCLLLQDLYLGLGFLLENVTLNLILSPLISQNKLMPSADLQGNSSRLFFFFPTGAGHGGT